MGSNRRYRICSVQFQEGGKEYYYLCEISDAKISDYVEVFCGRDRRVEQGRITSILEYTRRDAPRHINKLKRVIRVIQEEERFVEENGLRMSGDRTILYGYIGRYYKYTYSNIYGYMIVGVGEEITKLEVPDSIVEIAPKAFEGISSLQEILLNEGLQSIGDYAFANASLARVKLPSTVKNLGVCAFTNDDMFLDSFEPAHHVEVEIDNKNRYLRSDGKCIFKINEDRTEDLLLCYTPDIRVYQIADQVVRIQENAFLGCCELRNVTLGEQVRFIEKDAFNGCKIEKINLPASVEEISNLPYQVYWKETGERSRIAIDIAKDNACFYNVGGVVYKRAEGGDTLVSCSSEEAIISVQEGTTVIGVGAFAECSKLKKVLLPNTVKIIEKGAFRCCELLNTVTGKEEMYKDLEGLYLPDSIEVVDEEAFVQCGFK